MAVFWAEVFGMLAAAWLAQWGYRRMRVVAFLLLVVVLLEIAAAFIIDWLGQSFSP